MNVVKEHMRIWSLYWLAGAVLLIIVILGAWGIKMAVDTAAVGRAVQQDTALKGSVGSGTVEKSREKRAGALILPFATVAEFNLTLYLPAPYKNIRGIGYHESSHTRAYSMTPIGQLLKNDNAWDLDVELNGTAPLPTYNIMETRGEYAYGTTVADIAMDPETPVRAPVSGTVLKIESKVIYDEYEDRQIEVVPDGLPDVRVVFLHIDNIKIKPGDHLTQGKTIMGIPHDWRPYFASEIDDYIKPSMPHVHVQVNRPEPPQ
ncbi:MAG: M23 family metallopeptidase [Actinomycetota bacterium]